MRNPLRHALALLVVTLAGCSADRDVLIRVGNRVVTVEEFRSVARGNENQYPGTPEQAKAALLEDLLRRALLLHEAEQQGLFRDSVVTQLRRTAEDRILTEALLRSLNPDRIAVSDAEVARAVAWRDTASHLLLVFSPTAAAARAAADELRHGADFAAVADRFNPPGLMPAGGDFGYVTPGSMVAPIDGLLRTAPLGETVGPIEAPGDGWFLVRIVARERRPQEPADAQPPLVRELLRQRKRRAASIRAYAGLKQEYGFRLAPGAGTVLFAFLNRPGDPLAGLGTQLPPEPAPQDADRVLASWRDGRGDTGVYRLADALADLEQETRPPDYTRSTSLDYWIEQRAMRRVGLIEARKRLLDRLPDVRRRLDAAVDNQVLEAIYERDVAAEAKLFPLDVPAYYQTVRESFPKLEEVSLATVTLRDSAAAEELMRHAGHAPDLAAALGMAKVEAPVLTEVVRYPNPDPVWHAMSASFLRLPPGQTVGPVRTAAGWRIARLLAKKQRPAEWNELEPMLRAAVERQAEELRRDRALRKVTEHLKQLHAPVVHPERLRRIAWPVAPDLTGS